MSPRPRSRIAWTISSVTAPGPHARSTKRDPSEATRSTSQRFTSPKNGGLEKRKKPKRSVSGAETWTSAARCDSFTTHLRSVRRASSVVEGWRPGAANPPPLFAGRHGSRLARCQRDVDRVSEVAPDHRPDRVGDCGREQGRLPCRGSADED